MDFLLKWLTVAIIRTSIMNESMKVIFIQDVPKIAKKGQIKEVSEGYAANFLFPKKFAQPATASAVSHAKAEAERKTQAEKESIAEAKRLAEAARGQKVTVSMKEKQGKLFGSVGSKEVAVALRQMKLFIPEEAIALRKPFKTVGTYDVKLDFGHGIVSGIVVTVKGA